MGKSLLTTGLPRNGVNSHGPDLEMSTKTRRVCLCASANVLLNTNTVFTLSAITQTTSPCRHVYMLNKNT